MDMHILFIAFELRWIDGKSFLCKPHKTKIKTKSPIQPSPPHPSNSTYRIPAVLIRPLFSQNYKSSFSCLYILALQDIN